MDAKSRRTQQQAESLPSQKLLDQGRLVIASSLPGPSRPSFVLKGRPHLFFARRSMLANLFARSEGRMNVFCKEISHIHSRVGEN
jgi:hypothetical protein